ncbi:AraC-type DNA-binding protein [Siphonobacter aquaeclarae]|uniref:AraC-type DNA-binding protein n=2 Tax=Siphonobacter aquaeclarae TaxID=563176 RepID=A0A1G9Y3A4_9BACT|nr:AraC-type DNA-binding protein [Siphonobacter aquaeclarae]
MHIMSAAVKVISNFDYKKLFLFGLSTEVMLNDMELQLYRIENYLRSILIPVLPYKTTFNFLLFVTKGHIRQHLGVSEFQLEPGSMLLIRQGSITATLEISPDAEGFFLACENTVFDHVLLNTPPTFFTLTSPFVSLRKEYYPWMMQLFETLEQRLQAVENRNIEIPCLAFQNILTTLVHLDNQHTKTALVSRKSRITQQFKELIQTHHQVHKEVQFYADELSISENYLCKCIKETTGKAPKQWLNETTVQYSQVLLQNIGKDISSIAYELNFQSVSHFTRLFKKITGIPPSAYRKKIF